MSSQHDKIPKGGPKEKVVGPGHRVDDGDVTVRQETTAKGDEAAGADTRNDTNDITRYPKGDVSVYNRRHRATASGKEIKAPQAPGEDNETTAPVSSAPEPEAGGSTGNVPPYKNRRSRRAKAKKGNNPADITTTEQQVPEHEVTMDVENRSFVMLSSDEDDEDARPGAVSMPGPTVRPGAQAIRGMGNHGTGFESSADYHSVTNPETVQQEEESLNGQVVAVPIEATLAAEDPENQRLNAENEALRRRLEEQQHNRHDGVIADAEIIAKEEHQRHLAVWVAILIAALGAAAIAVALALILAGAQPGEKLPELQILYPELYQIFFPVSGSVLFEPESPQLKAFEWLAQDVVDPSAVPQRDLEQRYALAVLYFSTGNDSVDEAGWKNPYNFLQPIPVCEWNERNGTDKFAQSLLLGVSCNDTNASIVESVILPSNGLRGTLPSEIQLLHELLHLNMAQNELSGSIPTEIGKLTNLQVLELNNNQLNGALPTEICDIDRLLADCFVDCTCCTACCLVETGACVSFDQFTDRERYFFNVVRKVSDISALIDPTQPQSIAVTWLVDADQARLDPLTSERDIIIERYVMVLLYFSWNTPFFPPFFFSAGSVCGWNDGNKFGVFCKEDGRITEIDFDHQQLQGSIPREIFSLQALEALHLGDNTLTGTIPSEIGLCTTLQILSIQQNELNGEIPQSIGGLKQLRNFNGSFNKFMGKLPSDIGLLTDLTLFFIQNNQLTGTIPESMTNLVSLRQVDVSYNSLTDGANNLCEIASLVVYLADCYEQLIPVIEYEICCNCCSQCCSDNEVSPGCFGNTNEEC